MRNRLSLAFLSLALAIGVPAQAQWGALGGMMGGGGGGDADKFIATSVTIIAFSTIATDLAVSSAMQMLEAFPPEQVAAISEKFSKYNELKAARGADAQIDSNSETLASDGFTEMEKLDPATYRKDKAKVVGPAYTKLGLALAADIVAATQLPGYLSSGQKTLTGLTSNPMNIFKIKKITAAVMTGKVLFTNIPSQIKSIKTVRAIAKKIAEAENMTLGEPKEQVTSTDPAVLAADVKAEEVAG